MKQLRVMAWLWVAVLLTTGLAGGLVVSRLGWALAMGLAIYGGNTEPLRPELPFPWLVLLLCAVSSAAGLVWGLRDRRRSSEAPEPSALRALLPLVLAYLGGLVAAILPFIHVFRLWRAIG